MTKYFLALLFALFLSSTFAQDHNIKLIVKGCQNTGGNLMIAAFRGEHDFKLKENAAFNESVAVDNTEISLNLKSIPEGKYAIAIFHDENTDNKLNTNSLGIPSEGFGFSGDYSIFSKPKFKDCNIKITSDTTIYVEMHYLWN